MVVKVEAVKFLFDPSVKLWKLLGKAGPFVDMGERGCCFFFFPKENFTSQLNISRWLS